MAGSQRSAAFLSPTALLRAIGELADLLRSTDDDQFIQGPVAHFECCLGEQVRHVLDHVSCFVAGLDGGSLDYDRRQRGTVIEHDRGAALGEIARLDRALRRIEDRRADEPCAIFIHTYEPDACMAPVPSSLGRELSFVLSHTIHHMAIISAMAAELAVHVPPQVGYAPSTLAHLRDD